MRLVSYLRPSKQAAAAGEEAAAGQVSGLSACWSILLGALPSHMPSLSLWVSPQTRQIARKIFTDFCHVVSFGLEIPWTRICFNSA